jgi:hypothetical protein
MATRPDEAYVLTGRPYAAYLSIGSGDGVESSVMAGFPYSDEISLKGGGEVEIGAGGKRQRSGLAGKNKSPWFWVPPELWSRYHGDLGGPEGRLGYPVGPAESWNEGIRQLFEHGWIWYRQDRGALTNWEYAGGPTPTPAKSSAASSQTLIYQVDSDGGTPHEIPQDGSVRQSFKARTPVIDEIGVIVGVDPARSTERTHRLRLELRDSHQNLLAGDSVPLENNGLTKLDFAPVRVTVGEFYVLYVRNDSRDAVGVYLNSPVGNNRTADANARAFLIRELPNPKPHFDEHGALCGRVEGRL